MRDEIRRRAARIAWPILVTVLMLVGWEIAVRVLGIRSIILPPPSEVLAVMVERHDLLLAHLWPSLYLTVLGFALSVIGGILVAVLITYSSIVRAGFYPVIVVSQVVPKISIAPLFIVWFGTGTLSSLLLAFLIAFFPMTSTRRWDLRPLMKTSTEWRAPSWARLGRFSGRSACRTPCPTSSAA
jgi:ABC-type nitrate/sulfonate/bicarbonate transport system permease component